MINIAVIAAFVACSSVTTTTSVGTTETAGTTGTTPTTSTGSGITTTTETSVTTTETVTPPSGPVVVLFIGDGMGFEHVRGAGYYLNGAEGTLFMESLGGSGRGQTASLTGLTDSAASATTMATGHKTANSRLGQDADENDLVSVLEMAESLGWATGVVTTDKVVGATPSAFLTHVASRMDTETIVAQLYDDPPDVLLGGGFSYLLDSEYGSDVRYITKKKDLLTIKPDGRPLVGLFAGGQFPYVLDDDGGTPTLAEMTVAALDYIAHDPEGTILIVEGARIDHASHANDQERVFLEVASLDNAVEAAADWLADRESTIIVTADHECGGLSIDANGAVAGTPVETQWYWGDHTNDDVPIFASGIAADWFDGERRQNSWIHAALVALVTDTAIVEPTMPRVVDGDLVELGAVITTASYDTNAGMGFNQADGHRISADEEGVWIGVNGVVETDNNALVVLIDRDFGTGSGITESGQLSDTSGSVDTILSNLKFSVTDSRLGFDAASVGLYGQYVRRGELFDGSGVRVFSPPMGELNNLWWSNHIVNVDSGNMARFGLSAPDAGTTGMTEGGVEILMPWNSLFEFSIPVDGASFAFVVLMVNTDGTWISNQTMPSTAKTENVGDQTLVIAQFVTMSVDATGSVVAGPILE